MRRLGWTGPSVDRILITSEDGQGIIDCEGQNCVVARIQFDNRTEELTDGNMADATLMAAAPDLYAALHAIMESHGPGTLPEGQFEAATAALLKARGEL